MYYTDDNEQDSKAVAAQDGANVSATKTETNVLRKSKKAISECNPKNKRMSSAERTKIMIQQMLSLGIMRANAAFQVVNYAKNFSAESSLSVKALQVINAYLNADFDIQKEISIEAIRTHRAARLQTLMTDAATVINKNIYLHIACNLSIIATNSVELENAIRDIKNQQYRQHQREQGTL